MNREDEERPLLPLQDRGEELEEEVEEERARTRKGADEFVRHPKGLLVLSLTEIWERFSYYTTRAVLVLFARDVIFAKGQYRKISFADTFAKMNGVDFGDSMNDDDDELRRINVDVVASKLYGAYTAFVYLTPVFGGYLADASAGAHRMISIGLLLMFVGNFVIGVEVSLFFYGLSFVAIGNGAFKPNVSNRLSEMYEIENDDSNDNSVLTAKRKTSMIGMKDSAFGIFYCAINVGALFAPLVAGFLQKRFGYESCFLAAAVGMVIASLTYGLFQKKYVYKNAATDVKEEDLEEDLEGGEGEEENVVVVEDSSNMVLTLPNTNERDEEEDVGEDVLADPIEKLSLVDVAKKYRERLIALFVVMLTTVGFWAAYEQAGNALSLFIDERVTKNGIPTAAFQSINPGMILLLTPIINRYWSFQNVRKTEPDQVMKMAIGCLLLGLANVILAFASMKLPRGSVATEDIPTNEKLSQSWIWLYFLVATAGELYVSPVGLSFVTTAAPREILGLCVGCWFLSSFFGNYLAGEIGTFYAKTTPFAFWNAVGILSSFVGIALALLRHKITKALRTTHESIDSHGDSTTITSVQ